MATIIGREWLRSSGFHRPRGRAIQYAAASRLNFGYSGILDARMRGHDGCVARMERSAIRGHTLNDIDRPGFRFAPSGLRLQGRLLPFAAHEIEVAALVGLQDGFVEQMRIAA